MANSIPKRRKTDSGRSAIGRRLPCYALFVVLVSGCAASSGQRHYTYRTMPADLLVQKRENVQTLDLTRLALASKNSNAIDLGDVIEVTISAGMEEKDPVTAPVRVNDRGIAEIPEVGAVQVAGLEPVAAEAAITSACVDRQLYRNPNITVTMKQQKMNKVMVIGAVKKPGLYQLPRGKSDVLTAIYAAEGLEDDAGTSIEVRNPTRRAKARPSAIASGDTSDIKSAGHVAEQDGLPGDETLATQVSNGSGGMESVHIDLVSATKVKTGDYIVEDGGVVRVEKRDPIPLYVIGHVKKPNKYDFPISDDLRVTDAIAMAGGTSMSLANKIFVVRRLPNSSESAVIEVSFREAKRNAQANVRLEPGDVVSVESTPGTAVWETLNVVRFVFSGALLNTNALY